MKNIFVLLCVVVVFIGCGEQKKPKLVPVSKKLPRKEVAVKNPYKIKKPISQLSSAKKTTVEKSPKLAPRELDTALRRGLALRKANPVLAISFLNRVCDGSSSSSQYHARATAALKELGVVRTEKKKNPEKVEVMTELPDALPLPALPFVEKSNDNIDHSLPTGGNREALEAASFARKAIKQGHLGSAVQAAVAAWRLDSKSPSTNEVIAELILMRNRDVTKYMKQLVEDIEYDAMVYATEKIVALRRR